MPNTMIPVIQQRLKGDAESICFKCFHRKVCRAIDNQPCIECNQFTDANGVTFAEDNNVPSKWIPVTERLPHELLTVIIAVPRKRGIAQVMPAYLANGYWKATNDWCYETDEVSHWMPLPEPPKP